MECQSQIRTVPCPKNPSSFSFSCSEGQCSYCGLHLVLTCSLPTWLQPTGCRTAPSPQWEPQPQGVCMADSEQDACPPQNHKACLVTSFSSLLKCESCPGYTKVSYLIPRAFFFNHSSPPDIPYILLIYSLFLCVQLACMKQKFYSVLLTPRTMPFIQ